MTPTFLLTHSAFTGLSRRQFAALVLDLETSWMAARESDRTARRGTRRRRAAGAGPGYILPFEQRLLATLVTLRTGLPHLCLAVLFNVSRQTINNAVNELLPLLARRGIAAPEHPTIRLRTLADVTAYAHHHNVTLRMDGTDIQVRRPKAHTRGRNRFVSGKKRQNTMKTTIVSDEDGHVLHATTARPGRTHDQTALKYDGIDMLLQQFPDLPVLVDAGYRGLARDYPNVSAPPKHPPAGTSQTDIDTWSQQRKNHSTARIPVEHAIGSLKHWKVLQRWTGRRDKLPDIIHAIASLAADKRIDNQTPT